MATLKITLFKPKALKDGRHKIRIAVCHKQVTSYIITNYIVEENQFKEGQVVKRPDASMINRKLRKLLDQYQDRLDDIDNIDMYSCVQLKNMISVDYTDKSLLSIQDVSRKYEYELTSKGKSSYAKMLAKNRQLLSEFVDGEFCISKIDLDFLEKYTDFLRMKNYSDTFISMQLRHTRTIVNRAIKKQLVTYEIYPFVGFTMPSTAVRNIDISLEELNRLKDIQLHEKPFNVARDLFMLSFYLGGMNLIDILNVDFRNDTVTYVRTKTSSRTQGNRSISFSIPAEAKTIAAQWIDDSGKLNFGYKFNYENFRTYVNRELHKVAAKAGIENKIMFYSARKTFAQFASDLGIPDGIIDYCLGHSDKSKGVIRYYTKVRQQQADMAISRVIDYVCNPDKYKEYIELRNDIMMMRM